MRVSTLLCLGACLLSVATAEFRPGDCEDDDIERRIADSRSQQYFTAHFNLAEDTRGDRATFDGANLIGMIVGFVVTGAFMIFASAVLIRDEMNRHAKFAMTVEDDIKVLTQDYKVDMKTIEKW